MRRNSSRTVVAGLLSLMVLAYATPARAQQSQPGATPRATERVPSSLQLSQVLVRNPDVKVYLYVLDGAGGPLERLQPSQFAATVGAASASVVSALPFTQSAEGIAYVFLVDVSRSVTAPQFAALQRELKRWISALGTGDRAAVIAFGEEVRVIQDYSGDKVLLSKAIDALQVGAGTTQLYGAVAAGTTLARRRDPALPERRVAVLLSDGIDDAPRGTSKAELLEIMSGDPLPIYALAFANPPFIGRKQEGLQTLAELARRSGGLYVEPQDVAQALERARTRLNRAHVLQLRCGPCPGDGALHRVQVSLTAGTTTVSAGSDARFLPPPPPPPVPPGVPVWVWPLWGVSLIALIGGVVLVRRREPEPAAATEPVSESADSVATVGVFDAASMPTWRPPVTPTEPYLPPPVPPVPPHSTPATPQRGGVELQLAVITSPGGVGASRTVRVAPRAAVGRSAEVAFPNDSTMSGRHFEIVLEDGFLILRDLESQNGTTVNGVRIRRLHKLEDGDVITAGQTQMRVELARKGREAR